MMTESVKKLKELVDGSRNIVFFGGAGVSTESARKAAPPSMAGMTSHAPYLRINEYRAKMILQKRTSKHPNSHHT